MAEMTLEKAEKILAGYRTHGSYRNMTDLEIARAMDVKSARISAVVFFMAWSTSINMMWSSLHVYRVGLIAACLGVALFMYFRSRRFAMIREFFESQAPQYLNQLDLSQEKKRNPAHPATDW